MLMVTTEAMEVIRDLVAAEHEPASGGAHLRVPTVAPGEVDERGGVELEMVSTAPPATEQLLAGEGCRLFLDPDAAEYLRDKVLDATHDTDGQVRFTLTRQSTPPV
jgi:Fe-S cluster assembly iron-binding protein IscA